MKRSLLLWLLVAACNRSPAEPEPTPATIAPADTAEQEERTLEWTLPPGWSTERTAPRGTYRAKVRVPPVGDDKHSAELLISHLGRGPQADLDEAFARWFREFDGDVAAQARTRSFEVGAIRVRVAEVAGTYKVPMGPPVGPGGKHAAHVIRKDWRGICAGVLTTDRGSWFLRLVGPDETVQSARSGMDSLLQSLR